MKAWKLLIALLILEPAGRALGCGFYPYGEAVRFHLLESSDFGFSGMREFDFYTDPFIDLPSGYESRRAVPDYDGNVLQWQAYCKGGVPEGAVREAVYVLDYYDLDRGGQTNAMVRYLRETADSAALYYLAFAKQCELFNNFTSDPWERSEMSAFAHRNNINLALDQASRERNPELRARYAFLALRMDYYINGGSGAEAIWTSYFSGRKLLTTIDYWALYFRALSTKNRPLQNYYLALVFDHAPEKQSTVFRNFNFSTSVDSSLAFAKNAQERAAISIVYSMHNPGRALTQLRRIDHDAPGSRYLDFLILRELGKLEDWIYTPTYTYFSPSTIDQDYYWQQLNAFRNVAADRKYAAELLQLVRSRKAGSRRNPVIWQTAEAYLLAMSGKYREALESLHRARGLGGVNDGTLRQHDMLRTIWTVALMPAGQAEIPASAKARLMSEKARNNNAYLFAMGRELERKGATTSAALLYSRVNEDIDDYHTERDVIYWRTKRRHATWLYDYYVDYFYYMDAAYTAEQLKDLVAEVSEHPARDSFDRWLYAVAAKDLDHLRDQLGTKYIRRNDLAAALTAFRTVNDSLYRSEFLSYKVYMAANPFYTNLYNEHKPVAADTVPYTKARITEQLMKYLKLAEDPRTPDRSRYYFLVANCYLNMTQYGNSWMMRRYTWTSTASETRLEDDNEYFRAGFAQRYYLRAHATAGSSPFAALCLRMAGRCENYRLTEVLRDPAKQWYERPTHEQIYEKNPYWRQLRRQYPDYAEELISNCSVFERYYASGR